MHYFLSPLALLVAIGGLLTACGQAPEVAQAPAAASKAPATAPATGSAKRLLFFGNSLTAGLGVEPEEAFPALVGQKLDSAGLKYEVVNAGLSGETTAGGLARVGWVLRQPVAVFVLELGANDGLRGLPLADSRRNLQGIIDTVRRRSPGAQIVLAGMQIPPNLGQRYAADFKNMFGELATQNKLALVPFLLAGVGGDSNLNQRDGVHPTAAGQRVVARNVWAVLGPLLAKQPANTPVK